MGLRYTAQLHVILFDVSEHYLPDDRIFAPLLRLWRTSCRGGMLPSRAQLGFENLKPWLGSVAILRQEDHGEDFLYRLFGSRLVTEYHTDMTGRRLSDLPFGMGPILLAATSAAVEKNIPVFAVYKPDCDYAMGDRADLILPYGAPGDVMVASYPMSFSSVSGDLRAASIRADA